MNPRPFLDLGLLSGGASSVLGRLWPAADGAGAGAGAACAAVAGLAEAEATSVLSGARDYVSWMPCCGCESSTSPIDAPRLRVCNDCTTLDYAEDEDDSEAPELIPPDLDDAYFLGYCYEAEELAEAEGTAWEGAYTTWANS
jgi:hypothetical protein